MHGSFVNLIYYLVLVYSRLASVDFLLKCLFMYVVSCQVVVEIFEVRLF
jgi:hypothetical protein